MEIQSRTIIDFLIKTVFTIKNESLIFISGNKFNQEQIKYLNMKMSNIEDENKMNILTQFLQSNYKFIIFFKY